MVERYPLPGARAAVAAGGDTIALEHGEAPAVYLLLDHDWGFNITPFIEAGRAWIDTAALPVAGWLEGPPLLEARAARKIDEYAEWLAERLRRQGVRRVKALLGLSGGKDSTAALLVLEALQEHIDVKYKAVYIHVPFLEPERNKKHVERIARRTGAPIEVIEASRHWMKSMLKWRGLPGRGDRWCTVAKIKPMRRIMKKDKTLVEVVADRPTEAPKRLKRLWNQLASLNPLAGRKLRPILWLTLADTIAFNQEKGLTHPDYREGMQRVACLICPYRPLHEYPEKWDNLLEDPGIIEEAAKRKWRREIRRGKIPFQLYLEQHLWRYPGDTAVKLAAAKQTLAAQADAEAQTTDIGRKTRQATTAAWTGDWPYTLPVVGPEEIARLITKAPPWAAVMTPEGPRSIHASHWARRVRHRGRRD